MSLFEKDQKTFVLIDCSLEISVQNHCLDFAFDLLDWQMELLRKVLKLNTGIRLDQFGNILLQKRLIKNLEIRSDNFVISSSFLELSKDLQKIKKRSSFIGFQNKN